MFRLVTTSHLLTPSAARFIRIPRYRLLQLIRHQSAVANPAVPSLASPPDENPSLSVPAERRFNEIGVQQLSSYVYEQVFPKRADPTPKQLVDLAEDHLGRHDLLGKTTDYAEPVAFDIPTLQGLTLDEHFYKLGLDCAEPFLTKAKKFASATLPPKPRKWIRKSGWIKYDPSREPEKVEAPEEDLLCFDVEVMWKESQFAVMACAASPTAWYAWLSPWLLGESESDRQLIPLGDPTKERIIVGHNIGFDRARILEEYNLAQSRNAFIDTMSLHVAVNGMCSQQRPTWMRHKKNRELREKLANSSANLQLDDMLENALMEEPELWVERSSINSLREVAKFHLNITIDKAIRDDFGELDRKGVLAKLDELLDYCAADVAVTHQVYQIVFPHFLKTCPHPVSFAALRHLSSVILPINETWDAYITNTEATYKKLSGEVQDRLVDLTNKALEAKDDPEKWQDDPWMKQLDWSGMEIRMTKGSKKTPPRPKARQKLPGMPKWYKDLFPKATEPIHLSVRTRIAPLLLRLSWDGHPLVWSEKYGWTFRVSPSETNKYTIRQMEICDMSDEKVPLVRDDKDGVYFKLPHKDGPIARCCSPLAKGYLAYFESGVLSSEYPYAKEALEMNASCSYWISARDRIMSQMAVYEDDIGQRKDPSKIQGFILPQVIPMGTITRRAVEKTWLTASNAKKNRVGSELKSMVKAPPGYCFVGADVDSEELWIASLMGDATFKMHGGSAIGFMTLEGTKAAGTDMHSRTASILGITRNDAKIFNYGRIYGAGHRFAATLLRQFNHSLSEHQTAEIATNLYASTKGEKTNRKIFSPRPFWRGGTESFVFNKLEEFAEQQRPRTPVLGAGITEALMGRYIRKGGFITSRINWAVQSSGVDYLHLLIVGMDYLIRRFNINARLSITVHDEIRYLVKDEDKYRTAMALQVANLWTRVMFAQQVGIDDLPQSVAYFSAVDIDHVLRKEVDLNCVTPSHPNPIPPGESLDIQALLNKGRLARLDPDIIPDPRHAPNLDKITYVPRIPVMKNLDRAADPVSPAQLNFIKAQITNSEDELRELVKKQRELFPRTQKRNIEDAVGELNEAGKIPYQNSALLLPSMMMGEPITVRDVLGGGWTQKSHNQGVSHFRNAEVLHKVGETSDSEEWAPSGR